MKRILVSGALGFIGSAVVKTLLKDKIYVHGLARFTDLKNLRRLEKELDSPFLNMIYRDLTGDINGVCEGIDAVIHCAALTFVDRAILSPEPFVRNNIIGTFILLEDARKYRVKKFIQVSTDEVYGPILEGAHTEDAPIKPSNVYAASKAGADALAIAYAKTYDLNTLITRTENNYGEWQHPQKVIPAFVRRLTLGQKMPVYGDGQHRRNWLHVSDHVAGLLHLLDYETAPGDVYHIAGNKELTNIELARRIASAYGLSEPADSFIELVPDYDMRPGHDRRYKLDTNKLHKTGWSAKVGLEEGLAETVRWYKNNPDWLL